MTHQFTKTELRILAYKYKKLGYSEKEAYKMVANDIKFAEMVDRDFKEKQKQDKEKHGRSTY